VAEPEKPLRVTKNSFSVGAYAMREVNMQNFKLLSKKYGFG
jgi:hypothetical protein